MTRLYQPRGTKLTEDQAQKLTERIAAQRFNAETALDRLRAQRTREVDFITDTRNLEMTPIPTEVSEELVPIDEVRRLEPHAPSVAFIPADRDKDDWTKLTGGPVALNAHAHGQIAAHAKIPKVYYDRMIREDPELLAVNVNRWLRANPSKRMLRTFDARTITVAVADPDGGHGLVSPTVVSRELSLGRAFLSNKYRRLDSLDVHQLVCSNLMIFSSYSKRQIHIGGIQDELAEVLSDRTLRAEDRLTMRKMKELIVGMVDRDQFAALTATLKETKDLELANPIAATELLSRNLSLTEGEGEAIQDELIRAGDPTLWGLTSALTATARTLDFERKAELETAAGRIVESRNVWTSYAEAKPAA